MKDERVLNAAYNDVKGVTEAFNKNILSTLNIIMEADFDIGDFEHYAAFNREKARIEMHLLARKDMLIHSPFFDSDLQVKKGERIHTEDNNWFALVELRK